MTDDFSKTPQSIAEIKANKAEKASLWTPRDALVSLLRDIDSGKRNPSIMFIAMGEIGEHNTQTSFIASGSNAYLIQGVVNRALYMFQQE